MAGCPGRGDLSTVDKPGLTFRIKELHFSVRVVLRFPGKWVAGVFPFGVHELATFPGHHSSTRFFGLLTAFVLSLIPLGALPVAAGPCILPVEGGEPMSEVEREQPYRLASHPISLPGYHGLLLRPLNRPDEPGFHVVDGWDYRKLARPAPGSNIFDGDLRLARGATISCLGGMVACFGIDPLLASTDTGWMAFDGSRFTDLPELSAERVGDHARILRVGPLVLIQSL